MTPFPKSMFHRRATDDGMPVSRHNDRRPNDPASRERTKRIKVRFGLAALVMVLLAGCTGGLLAYQALAVRGQLEGAVDLVPLLRTQLSDGNQKQVEHTFDAISSQTAAARETTDGPLWTIAASVPFVGANFSALREIAVSADDLTTKAGTPLLSVYGSLELQMLSPKNGQVDISQLQDVAPSIIGAAETVRLSHDRLASIDLATLVPQLAGPVRSATDMLGELNSLMNTASSIFQLLPAMLGAEDSRDYLVLVQNSSETRATGGIPGALAVLHTDDGHISLGEQTSAVALGAFRPAIDVDSEQVSLYTRRLGTQMQNVNLTPDFPTAAQTAKEMWEQRHSGQKIDGVLALDTVVLSHLLEATGPLDLTDPQVLDAIRDTDLPLSLTKDNVVPTLLSKVYKDIENPEAQDAYFATVASRVFSAFTEGQGNGAQLIKALGASTAENRLFLWSSHPAEEKIIASTPVHGSVAGPDGGGAAFGVYFNDGTGAKMDYYVTRSVQLIQSCPVGDYGQYTVRITVSNNAPADAASSLPAYVTGNGAYGIEPGRIRTNYVVYGPSQAFVETATVDSQPVPVSSGKHRQRPVGTVALELGPGETATIDVAFSKVVQNSEPHLRITPTVQSLEEVVLPLEREGCD
ncbi:DUF4012 domain-containing protein [Arthrobacter sp. NPDC097144]|uniref:DUF4012 domain-containing protein n=1 Tax=Arthrobacter sp. NPDC097144 TaxID=3363946 RepID=UPI0038024CFF